MTFVCLTCLSKKSWELQSNDAVNRLCHVVDVCSKMLTDFHDYCLFNSSDQLVVGIVFSYFWLEKYKNIVLRYSMTSKQFYCVKESLKY